MPGDRLGWMFARRENHATIASRIATASYNCGKMSTTLHATTAEELLRLPRDGRRYELVDGELREMTPSGYEHGRIIGELHWRLGQFVSQHRLGQVIAAETGFLLSRQPDTVRAPDIAFVRAEREQELGVAKAYFPEAPALVVEVVSPNDTVYEVGEKIRRWLIAGAELAWVISPAARTVTVYRSLDDIQVVTERGTLSGEKVLPGFECPVSDIFG